MALLGARQVGKTTLAKTIAQSQNSVYLDLEAPEDLLKLSDPTTYLESHSDKLIILDEIQRAPNCLRCCAGLSTRAGNKVESQRNFYCSVLPRLIYYANHLKAWQVESVILN